MPAPSPPIAPVAAEEPGAALLRIADAAMAAAGVHERRALRDLAMPSDHRLDERTLAALSHRLAATLTPIKRDLRLGAAHRLGAMQAGPAAERLLDDPVSLLPDITALAAEEGSVLAELLAIVRLEALTDGLPPGESAGADRPSLLARLVTCPEADIAAAASALLVAQNRQAPDAAPPLPAALRNQLVWWTAALLRERAIEDPRVDHALAEAAIEMTGAAPAAGSPQTAAIHLAELVCARPGELAGLLEEAIGDRQPALFIALLAQASGLAFEAVRDMLVDPAGERLWTLLRAQDLARPTIARIGVALAEADRRRDLDRFAAALDAAMTVEPERAAAVFASAALPARYRAALADVQALDPGGRAPR